MSVPYSFLGLLSVAEMHGYDLRRAYERVISPDRAIQPGQVYSTLQRLERDGQIVVAAVEQDDGPERRRYAVTVRGSSELEAWFLRPEVPAPVLQSELFSKVIVALLCGFPVERLLDTQRSAHLQRMRELTRQRQEGGLSMTLLADFALFHLEADLRWLDLTTARLRQLEESLDERLRATDLTITRRPRREGGNVWKPSTS